jgi:hypothetical protein
MRELKATDRALQWVTVSRKNLLFELRSDGDTIMEMKMDPRYRADASTVAQQWHFMPYGFLLKRVAVTDAGTGQAIATFFYKWPGRGFFVMSDGRKFKWCPELTPPGLLNGRKRFTRANRPLVVLECMPSLETMLDGMSEEVEIVQAGVNEPDNLLLIAAGWYVIARKILESLESR